MFDHVRKARQFVVNEYNRTLSGIDDPADLGNTWVDVAFPSDRNADEDWKCFITLDQKRDFIYSVFYDSFNETTYIEAYKREAQYGVVDGQGD